MFRPLTYSFQRYLSAKKTVDDRALNRGVWEALRRELADSSQDSPAILEIGAGIGTMLERVIEWVLLDKDARYHALDERADNIETMRERLSAWAAEQAVTLSAEVGATRLSPSPGPDIIASMETVDLFDFIETEGDVGRWDLLIAHAFLDLMDIPATLPRLFRLAPGGLAYFSITFDGVTALEPSIDADYDAWVEALYHRTMDARITGGKPSGDSQAGRHLYHHLREAGAQVIAAGASDWVVHAGQYGYAADEAYFLHFIVHTMEHALADHPELGDKDRFARWIEERHRQIENNDLFYIAHQLDYLARLPT